MLFLDTDAVPAPDSRSGDSLKNKTEAELVQQLLISYLYCGVPAQSLGVISPYRTQLKIIRHLLGTVSKGIEISTVDKFQGRDKDCIIISLVRSNSSKNVTVFSLAT